MEVVLFYLALFLAFLILLVAEIVIEQNADS